MPKWAKAYVRVVERVNYRVGRFAMYLLFVLMGVLLWSSLSKFTPFPSIWTLETAQFIMVAYYIIGGPYSLQLDSNVRMDLLYGSWSNRTRTWVDAFSIFALIFFLVVLLIGGIESTIYSLQYGERSPTAWRPYIAPIKIVMDVGFLLMILQSIAFFLRDVASIRGEEI